MVHEPPNDGKLTPAVIAKAPDTVPAPQDEEFSALPDNHPLWALISDLQVENAILKAENDRLNAESDPEIVKARLLKPYSNKIFWFSVAYTVAAFSVLGLSGSKYNGFQLPDAVLAVLIGTSFVAVLAPLGIIASGLLKREK